MDISPRSDPRIFADLKGRGKLPGYKSQYRREMSREKKDWESMSKLTAPDPAVPRFTHLQLAQPTLLQDQGLPSCATGLGPGRAGCGHPARREDEPTYPKRGVPARLARREADASGPSLSKGSWTSLPSSSPQPLCLLSTAALSPRRESPLRLICSAGSQGYEGTPSDTGERAPRGMDLRSGHQDIGGTWRPKAAGTRKQGRIPPEKREITEQRVQAPEKEREF
eukprot:XP_028333343.1 uncharacterized protein LOC114484007 [Physeter catodon]